MAPTILVADDDPAIRAVCQDILELEGYTVLAATTGQEALELAAQIPPALALMDIQMPELDGITACQRLRAATGATGPRLVLMSAGVNLVRHQADLQCADAVLAKPFDLDQLVALVGHLIAA